MNKIRLWNKQDVKTLRQYFGRYSSASVANMLQRSIRSIESKALRLGLHKTKKYLRSLGRV